MSSSAVFCFYIIIFYLPYENEARSKGGLQGLDVNATLMLLFYIVIGAKRFQLYFACNHFIETLSTLKPGRHLIDMWSS